MFAKCTEVKMIEFKKMDVGPETNLGVDGRRQKTQLRLAGYIKSVHELYSRPSFLD